MFSSRKILKPDVPPKRHNAAPRFLGRLFRLLPFSPSRQPLAVGDPVNEMHPAAEQKVLRRHGS
jgi:hypothetical protein